MKNHGFVRCVSLAALALISVGCEPSGLTVDIDVHTGLLPGREFGYVTVEVAEGLIAPGSMPRGARLIGEAVSNGDIRFGDGARIAELELAPGTYTFRGVLRRPAPPGVARDAGAILIERWITVPIRNDRVVTIPLTGDCVALECPAPAGSASFNQCMNGRCVDPRCDPSDPSTFDAYCCDASVDDCSEPTVCEADGDCTPIASCVEVTCDEGVCVEASTDSCGPGLYCSRTSAMCESAEMADAGPADAGMFDAPIFDDAGPPCDALSCPFVCVDGQCRGPEWTVARGVGIGFGIAMLGESLVVVGSFEGSLTFDGCPGLASLGDEDIFVARFDDLGVCAWARSFGSVGLQEATAVTTDGADHIFVTGISDGTIDFGGGPRVGAGEDVFVLSLAAGDGAHEWSYVGGSAADAERGAGIALDRGPLGGEIVVATTEQSGLGDRDIGVRRFSAGLDGTSGGLIRGSTFVGGASFDEASAILVIPGAPGVRGDLLLGGVVSSRADLNGGATGGVITPVGESDAFVARYDGAGVLQWVTPTSGPNRDDVFGMATTGDGQVIVGGAAEDAREVDLNAVIFGVDLADGTVRWATGYGFLMPAMTMNDIVAGLAVDASGGIHMSGMGSGDWQFVSSTVGVRSGSCPLGCEEAVIAHLAPGGIPTAALVRSATVVGFDYFRAIVTDGDRDFVTGTIDGQVRVEAIRLRP